MEMDHSRIDPVRSSHGEIENHVIDEFLAGRPGQAPFDPVRDYDEYVDGKPREDGVRSFLEARGIRLEEADVHRLAARKDALFLDLVHRDGVQTYPGSVRYLDQVRRAGLLTAVVSSSKNTTEVLKAAGLTGRFDVQVDGIVAEDEHLHGKPAPDTYLAAAWKLGLEARSCAVYEDALAGVAAGRAGGFGIVVGVDRAGQRDALLEHGATVVVGDLGDLLDQAA